MTHPIFQNPLNKSAQKLYHPNKNFAHCTMHQNFPLFSASLQQKKSLQKKLKSFDLLMEQCAYKTNTNSLAF